MPAPDAPSLLGACAPPPGAGDRLYCRSRRAWCKVAELARGVVPMPKQQRVKPTW